MQINKTEIQARKEKLEACKIYLKKEFIDIEGTINSLLDYLQEWYLMPEALNRPVIVNLCRCLCLHRRLRRKILVQ